MDILSNLTNLLGAAAAGQSQQGGMGGGAAGGLGGLGALAGLLGGGAGGTSSAGADPLGGLGGLVGALLGGGGSRGGASSGLAGLAGSLMGGGGGAGAAGGLGALGGLVGSLMGGQGGNMLSQLLGGEQAPPAPHANIGNPDQARAVNTLRALVYAARADGKLDDQEKQAIGREVQNAGLTQEGQNLVNQFLAEEVDPNKIAQNITSSQEALQIYALSCAITRMDTFMEKNYLEALAQSLRIPAQTKMAIEQKIAQ